MVKMLWAGLGAGLLLLVAGCSDDQGSSDTADRPVSVEQVASELDCSGPKEIDPMEAPIRGGAATRGISCLVGRVVVHIFERAPEGDLDDSDEPYAFAQGGSLENIDRLLGTGEDQYECRSWLLIGDSWFVLASDEALLKEAERSLGGGVRPVQVASPPASYAPPGELKCS